MSVSAEFIEFFSVSTSIKQPNSLFVVIYSNFTNHRLARKRLPRPGVAVEVDEVRSDGKKLRPAKKTRRVPASESSDGDARVRGLRERDFIVQRALFFCAGILAQEFREGASFFGGLVRFQPSSRLRHAGGGVPDADPASN